VIQSDNVFDANLRYIYAGKENRIKTLKDGEGSYAGYLDSYDDMPVDLQTGKMCVFIQAGPNLAEITHTSFKLQHILPTLVSLVERLSHTVLNPHTAQIPFLKGNALNPIPEIHTAQQIPFLKEEALNPNPKTPIYILPGPYDQMNKPAPKVGIRLAGIRAIDKELPFMNCYSKVGPGKRSSKFLL
jgi:hypothetical protein